jgi:hypothetical protein
LEVRKRVEEEKLFSGETVNWEGAKRLMWVKGGWRNEG